MSYRPQSAQHELTKPSWVNRTPLLSYCLVSDITYEMGASIYVILLLEDVFEQTMFKYL